MDQVTIDLRQEQWTSADGVYVRGNAFRDGEFHGSNELATLFQETEDADGFRSTVASLNGFFSVIVQSGRETFAALDRWRSFPLFYSVTPETVYVSDDAHWICAKIGCEIDDETTQAEYRRSLFVSGDDTLARDVKQLQGAELLLLQDGESEPKVSTERCYRFGVRHTRDREKDRVIQEYESVLQNVFQRLVEFAAGRPIAVSLSAGSDSRIIAMMLAEIGYPDLLSFAYTRQGEEKVAKDVADKLGIPFEHVSISHDEIAEWYRSKQRRRFDRESGWLDAVPGYWLAFAMGKLKRESGVPADAIIVTGDGAQTMASHVPKEFTASPRVTKEQFVDKILEVNHVRFDSSEQVETRLRERVLDVLETDIFPSGDAESAETAIAAFEEWDWQERQCKAIRSNFVYEYFDYEWWCPLKDHEYMDFWRDMPLRYRQGKSIHDEYVERRYREITGEYMAESSFLTAPKWLWALNATFGRVPVAGSGARRLYRRLFKSGIKYDPKYGMMGESRFYDLVNELRGEGGEVGPLTPRHVHAMNILDQERPDVC